MKPYLQSSVDVHRSRIEPRFVRADAWKRLGLIALATDLTTERDYRHLLPADGLGLYTTRVPFENPTTPENLVKMTPRLTAAAKLLPDDQRLEAICYSCTAASVVIGDEAVSEAIQVAHPGVPVVTPSQSAVLAFAALGTSRISVLSPYLVETSEPMFVYFTRKGLDIQRFECFGLDDDRDMARVSSASIVEAACAVDDPYSEALFISCTGLPAVAVIQEIEQRLGKPVVTSNQATAWALLQLSGIEQVPEGYGQIFHHCLPTQ